MSLRAFSFRALALLFALVVSAAAQKIPVLLVTGQNNHDWEYSAPIFEKMLEASGRFDVTLTTEPAKVLADAEELARYQLIFLDYNGERWGEAAEKNFLAAVRGGTGVVVIHAADNAFPGWKEYELMVGHLWRDGAGHGRFHAFDVVAKDRNHPITAGMPDLKDHPDELYHRLTLMHDAPHRVLMSALSSKESGGTGREEPMAVVLEYGAGRIFHNALGHVWKNSPASHVSLADPQFHLLVCRGSEWAATGRCTLTPKDFGLEPLATGARRPREAWAFDAILEGRPKVLVAALDPLMWVAYDRGTCQLLRAWAGDFVQSGYSDGGDAVPNSRPVGLPFLRSKPRPVWALVRRMPGGEEREQVAPQWSGHRIEEDRLVISYRIALEGREILVEESPEHAEEGAPVLERRFSVTGLAPGEHLELSLGNFRAEVLGAEGDATLGNGILLLGSDGGSLIFGFQLVDGVR